MLTDRVFTEEGQVEDRIKGGSYRLIFENEFNKLDRFPGGPTG